MLGFGALAKKVFGTANDRKVKAARKVVVQVNALEPEISALSDEQLRGKTVEFRERVAKGESLDSLLPEAFAVAREGAKRALGMRPFDVQILGGYVLHTGKIAEMRTGEGKTLVATMPVYLNALEGKGVHVVTVNDYLAQRDADWMGAVYKFLGLSVGVIVGGMEDDARRAAYACDVTYATNNELGFDYLRDNMKYSTAQMAQRGHRFAIVDEVDSILIDEARTPLIISGPAEDSSALYNAVNEIIPSLEAAHYEVDEKQRTAILTDDGNEFVEEQLKARQMIKGASLYDPENITLVHHVNQALRAHKLFTRDKDYVVRQGKVILIDEFTGRMMDGRRLSDGLHQAIEAKEKVSVNPENHTLALVTFQNYFRLYDKLAGMTGTALTEADEFMEIYKLDVIEIPTNRPVSRIDEHDEVYRTEEEKYQAIVKEIEAARAKGQPILVGTTSIEKSEQLAQLLIADGYRMKDASDPEAFAALYDHDEKVFAVLNAKFHEMEALIVAQAGVPGAITIATNMAGRGTDIQLGGNVDMRIEAALVKQRRTETESAAQAAAADHLRQMEGRIPPEQQQAYAAHIHQLFIDQMRSQALEAIRAEVAAGQHAELAKQIRDEVSAAKQKAQAAGGLYVLATERHESRRIDNQLRGRSGRQGDPGRSKFYLSLQDDLMRIFGSERMDSMLQRLGLKPGEPIIHTWVNKAIEKSQGKVEARNFDIRKNLLKFDDVMNDQRKAIFEQRREIMESSDISDIARDMRHALVDDLVAKRIPPRSYADTWDIEGLANDIEHYFGAQLPVREWAAEEGVADDEIRERLYKESDELAARQAAAIGPDQMRSAEKELTLRAIDEEWRLHLVRLDHLRQVVGLRGYAQRDPLNEYKSEAFTLFDGLLGRLRGAVTRPLMRISEIVGRQRQQMLMMYLQSAEGQAAVQKQLLEQGITPNADTELTVDTPFGPTTLAFRAPPQTEAPQADAAPAAHDFPAPENRNAPCPCGSGEKYKHCHGKIA